MRCEKGGPLLLLLQRQLLIWSPLETKSTRKLFIRVEQRVYYWTRQDQVLLGPVISTSYEHRRRDACGLQGPWPMLLGPCVSH